MGVLLINGASCICVLADSRPAAAAAAAAAAARSRTRSVRASAIRRHLARRFWNQIFTYMHRYNTAPASHCQICRCCTDDQTTPRATPACDNQPASVILRRCCHSVVNKHSCSVPPAPLLCICTSLKAHEPPCLPIVRGAGTPFPSCVSTHFDHWFI